VMSSEINILSSSLACIEESQEMSAKEVIIFPYEVTVDFVKQRNETVVEVIS
jgi:hypothetical protein